MKRAALSHTVCKAAFGIAALCILAACNQTKTQTLQGYIEGEFVYVSAPLGGALENLAVQRGDRVTSGTLLFTLDARPERAAHDEALRRLAQSSATLENAKKGQRPTELDAIRAQLKQAQAALALAEQDVTRRQDLAKTGAVAQQEIDHVRSTRDQAAQRVAQLSADLKTAHLGARSDEIAADEANVRALAAALTMANWNLNQKRQDAPAAGQVFDTLYRQGEWVAPGQPVVVLLPPADVKLRAFVPEARIAAFHQGDALRVKIDGLPQPLTAKISFISPQAEYTPPVIYSNESRSKLVFMLEALFDPQIAAKLHPGQPADVELGSE